MQRPPPTPAGPPPGGYGGGPPQDRNPYGPYSPPQAGSQQGMFGTNLSRGYTPFCGTCPQCQSTYLTTPNWTWWGGWLGPKLASHTVCDNCGFAFNAKTGKSNKTAIAIYLGVTAAIGVLGVLLLRALG